MEHTRLLSFVEKTRFDASSTKMADDADKFLGLRNLSNLKYFLPDLGTEKHACLTYKRPKLIWDGGRKKISEITSKGLFLI